MTRKEVMAIIEANPGKRLYVNYTAGIGPIIGFHDPISKTKALRIAKHIKGATYGTFMEQRPDLAGKKILYGDQQIVTFETATRAEG